VGEFIAPAVEAVGSAQLRLAVREEKWRNREEMLDFYRSLDVYVCASRSEGTPNPCLEAAACGLPVVTTRVGNMPELIGDGENGFFVERDVADIADKLRRLRDDPALRDRLASCPREGRGTGAGGGSYPAALGLMGRARCNADPGYAISLAWRTIPRGGRAATERCRSTRRKEAPSWFPDISRSALGAT
jgi:hypothetical protein